MKTFIEKTNYGYKVRTSESSVDFKKALNKNKKIEGFLSAPGTFEIYTEMDEEQFTNFAREYFYI